MNKNFQVGWWLIVLTVILMLVSPFMFSQPILNNVTAVTEYAVSLVGELMILIPAAIGVLYIRLTKQNENSVLPFGAVPWQGLVLSVMTIFGAQYFITYMTLPLQAILIVMFGADTATSQMSVPTGVGEFLLAFLTLCVAAPIVEEILCRGVLIKLFKRYGAAVALIASSLAFAMLHFEARSFIQIFFVGLLLGVFRIYSGSLVPCIVMHSANNFLSLCQLSFFGDGRGTTTAICTFLAIVFVPIVYITFVRCKKYFLPEEIAFGYEKTGFSLGACICIGLFAVYNLMLFIENIINL